MSLQPPLLAREIAAALAYWRACGVDCDFTNEAQAWLADPADRGITADAATKKPAPQTGAYSNITNQPVHAHDLPPSPALRRDYWGESRPSTLADFRAWWMQSEAIEASGLYPRIAPRGAAGAKLMVIVTDPESMDSEHLLSGPQGRLLAGITAAMGLSEKDCYIASALPCHTPLADLARLALGGLDTVLARHIALVAPSRIVLFGQSLAAFLGREDADIPSPLRDFNYAPVTPPFMVTETLGSMLDVPRLKARFWRRWMEWSA